MSRNGDPRDDPEKGSDDIELVELGETRIPTRLEVAPTAVGAGRGRRVDPRIGLVLAIAIVTFAVLGTGPLAPRPTGAPSPTPSSATVASTSAAPTDDCPGTAKVPTVSLGQLNASSVRAEATGTADEIDAVGVVAPVGRPVEVETGRRLEVKFSDRRCVDLLGIDLFDTSRPQGSALAVRVPSPIEDPRPTTIWDSPPAGDWIVRIAVRLRNVASAGPDGLWAIYLFRMNSGYVPWSSPVPSGVDGGAVGALVTPTAPCAPLPDGPAPPAVELHVGDTAIPGMLGAYQWRGSTSTTQVPEGLAAASPVELTWPFSVRIAGDVCATNWSLTARPMPIDDAGFGASLSFDESPQNESHVPSIASQNVFSVGQEAYGTYAVEAVLTFASGDQETVYWLVEAPVPSLPLVHVVAGPGGAFALPLQGCGAAFQVGDRYGMEICAGGWPELAADSALSLTSGAGLRVDADGETIVGWEVAFSDPAAIDPSRGFPECPTNLISGWSEIGLKVVELPEMPPGLWIVRVSLSMRTPDGTATAPYYLLISVDGPLPSPTPRPSCGYIH